MDNFTYVGDFIASILWKLAHVAVIDNLPLYSLCIKENLFVIVFSIHVTSYGTAVNYITLSGYAWASYIVKGRHCKLLAEL